MRACMQNMAMLLAGVAALVGANHAMAQGKTPLPVSRYSQPGPPGLLPSDLRMDSPPPVPSQDSAVPQPQRKIIATSEDKTTSPSLATPEVRPAAAVVPPLPTPDVPSPVKAATYSTPPAAPRKTEVLAAEPILPVAGGREPVVQVQSAGVSVEKSGPETVQKGKPFHYEIVVRNTGTTPVYQVDVHDELPAGARLISAEPQPEPSPGPLFWHIGYLDGGQERRFKVEIETNGEGELLSRATAVFATTAMLRTRIAPAAPPALTLTMHGPETGRIGDMITFDMQITNTSGRPLNKVRIDDQLPAGLQHPQGNEIHADLGSLAIGETRTVTLQTRAVKPGKFTNEARLSAEGGTEVRARSTVVLSDSPGPALGSH